MLMAIMNLFFVLDFFCYKVKTCFSCLFVLFINYFGYIFFFHPLKILKNLKIKNMYSLLDFVIYC